MPAKDSATPKRKPPSVSLRRNRRSTITDLPPGAEVTAVWDREKWEWVLIVTTAEGVTIRHEKVADGAHPDTKSA